MSLPRDGEHGARDGGGVRIPAPKAKGKKVEKSPSSAKAASNGLLNDALRKRLSEKIASASSKVLKLT